MCCVALLAFGFGPRLALLLVWIFGDRVDRAFDSWIWPFLGLLFLPTLGIAGVLFFGGQRRGVFGFVCMKLGFPPAPMLLGYVLGPMMEENLRRSMLMSGGDPTVFVKRPISVAFIVATVAILIVMVLPAVRRRRQEITD